MVLDWCCKYSRAGFARLGPLIRGVPFRVPRLSGVDDAELVAAAGHDDHAFAPRDAHDARVVHARLQQGEWLRGPGCVANWALLSFHGGRKGAKAMKAMKALNSKSQSHPSNRRRGRSSPPYRSTSRRGIRRSL